MESGLASLKEGGGMTLDEVVKTSFEKVRDGIRLFCSNVIHPLFSESAVVVVDDGEERLK